MRGAVIHSAAARLGGVFSWLEFRMPRLMLQLPGRRKRNPSSCTRCVAQGDDNEPDADESDQVETSR